ncbi:MAG: hypothetical protein HQ553_06225 [Chloroflexi bacterium]|nr:hypothetical protein [Chloroflexota bacterium]
MIRMVKNVIGHSYIIICIVLLLLTMACSKDDQTPPTGTSPDPGETVGISDDNPIVVMMKITPYDLRSFVFADVQAMRNDPDVNDYLAEGEGPSGYLDSYGMDLNDIDQSAVASYAQGLWIIPPLQIVTGDFDLESIKDLLGSERYTEHEFAGIEIWDVQIDEYTDAVAFMGDVVLIGYGEEVRNAIETEQGIKPSLFDDVDFSEVANRLPLGISIAFREGEFLGRRTYEGLLVTGLSAVKADESTIELIWVIKFEDVESAENTLDDVRSHVEGIELPRFTNVEVVQTDQFIKVNAQTGIEDYFGGGAETQNESTGASNPSAEGNE